MTFFCIKKYMSWIHWPMAHSRLRSFASTEVFHNRILARCPGGLSIYSIYVLICCFICFNLKDIPTSSARSTFFETSGSRSDGFLVPPCRISFPSCFKGRIRTAQSRWMERCEAWHLTFGLPVPLRCFLSGTGLKYSCVCWLWLTISNCIRRNFKTLRNIRSSFCSGKKTKHYDMQNSTKRTHYSSQLWLDPKSYTFPRPLTKLDRPYGRRKMSHCSQRVGNWVASKVNFIIIHNLKT